MRLVITVLLLMVLPTALLSLLAGRSIQSRELILERQIRDDALVRLEAVAEQVDQRLDEALAGVVRMFRETVLVGSDVRRLDASRLTQSAPDKTVRQVFLFMNPVGFIYPETTGASATGAVAGTAMRLQPELIRALAAGGGIDESLRVVIRHDECHCLFVPVSGYRDLYAGIEIDHGGFLQFVQRELDRQSTRVLRLRLCSGGDRERLDGAGERAGGGTVLISDSLVGAVALGEPASGFGEEAVATRHLPALGTAEIAAFVVDGNEMRRAHALQARLVGWGILLLVVMILGSALALISGTQRQVQTARHRSEFMAGMSHDLRTPVAAMRVMAESLQAGRVTDEGRRREFLDAIVSECDRLGDLIERIMFYFRQERGMLRYEKRLVAADAIAATVVDRFRRQHPGRVRIELARSGRVPAVMADANAVEKALTNLIDNAVKYGQRPDHGGSQGLDEGVDITVHAEGRREGRRVWTVLAVRDHGEGIAIREHRRIFDRFYRAYSGGHAHRGGFGLGLSMVADIVKAHRGRIRVSNAPDGGAVFELWLRGVEVEEKTHEERNRHE
jgi:signal transduction histidine kinase